MISFKGPGAKIIIAVIAAVTLCIGVWLTFFHSVNFEKTTATIVSIENDPDYVTDPNIVNDERNIVTVRYTVDGREYTRVLDSDSPAYHVGGKVVINYDPEDPAAIHSGSGFGIYAMIAGGGVLLILALFKIKSWAAVKRLKEQNGETVYAPSEKGGERELYFISDLGTPRAGHRIEDKNGRVLYEARMTRFTVASPFGFDFIDHEHNKVTPHLVGHAEEIDRDSIIFDNNYTLSFDGKDIWKHLRDSGVTLNSRFGRAGGIMPSYSICRDGAEIAYAESTSRYVHEEDAEEHRVMSKIPAQGFCRVYTREKNLDLLFTVLLAMARCGASDERGGSHRMIFNTISGVQQVPNAFFSE